MSQITFNSQEEFEDAVMKVLQERLRIEVTGDRTNILVELYDSERTRGNIAFDGVVLE
jgi:hypothetical protein